VLKDLSRPSCPLVSIVVPVYNEEGSVRMFVDIIRGVLEEVGLNYELIFVNDGSEDRTFDRAIELAQADPRLRVLNLSRNFGKEIAITAGIDQAVGDVVVPMDVDLQDPPELIPRFIERWREGYDVVYGVRTCRKHDTLAKRASAVWFYRLFNRLSDLHIPENAGDFRLIDRRVADVLRRLPERNRFMKGLFSWVGFRSVGVPYERPARSNGRTKWNHWRLWNFALDGLLSFSTLPLRVWTYVGSVVAALSFAYGSFIVIRTLVLGVDLPGYASLLTTVLFLGGVQLLSIGVIGEYLGRLFIEVKGRPLYIVESTYPPRQSPQGVQVSGG
jgi:glycosyltransferase involved in cell wall biosynthesis